jgi:chromosome segregation ATPase
MEWQVFEILEEKIDQMVKRLETITQENKDANRKIQEKEEILRSAQERIDALEEEKALVKSKIEGILVKINLVLG